MNECEFYDDRGTIDRWFDESEGVIFRSQKHYKSLGMTMKYLNDYQRNPFPITIKTKYPDGQISCTIDATQFAEMQASESIIWCNLESYEDLFYLMSFAEAISNYTHSNNVKIYIPCLFGQRSDRRFFGKLNSFDLKVIARCINSCNFANVYIFDPHSDVSLALIDRSVRVPPNREVENSVIRLSRHLQSSFSEIVLVSPDAGAYKKTYGIADDLELDMIASNKVRRDNDIHINVSGDVIDKNLLIVDDLADGGGTFKLLSKELKHMGAKTVSLYVSHGLFTKGFDFPDLDAIFIGDTGKVLIKK